MPHKGDHPRLRGEQCLLIHSQSSGIGSPPLARGTGTCPPCRYWARRITPACAGNSRPCCGSTKAGGDHPRLRGEQLRRAFRKRQYAGSPPLARGTVLRFRGRIRRRGITPACAGNRRMYCDRKCICEDHPRLRGEQSRCRNTSTTTMGSPPLARGTD